MLRHLLYLDASGLSCWYWQARALTPGPSFRPDDAGYAEFAGWLEDNKGGYFTLLTDCVEEGFQVETTPYVVGADRRALIARKQNQFFYGSPYASAVSLGRERSGRRDERILFAALTRPALLEPWMERLRAADVVLTSITSPALLLGHAMRHQVRANARLLVVTRTPAGLRQTLFEDGSLRFSRLATTAESHTSAWGASIPFEVQKTYQYLVTQRALARGTQVVVAVIVHGSDLAAVRSACVDSDSLHYLLLDSGERAATIGLATPPEDSDALPLLLHTAATHGGNAQFAPPRDRMAWRWAIAQRVTLACGLVALAIGLMLAGKAVFDTRMLRQSIEDTLLDAQSNELRYERLLSTMPKLPVSLDALQAGIGGIERIDSLADGPADALVRLSRALDRHPAVTVKRIEWSLAAEQVDEAYRASAASPAKAAAVRDVVTLEATLPANTPLSQREAVLAINEIIESLRREGAIEASVVRLPFEYTSDRTLRSSVGGRDPDPRFVLKASYPERRAK
ncbi:hypothetical protein OPU71_01740 [Niveibacterium sp. 24ML]|uniref:hypothetical protein n=1 Tax=Niveibacterium sp. 24ML TaxID=2985512 RepID=UPI00226FB15A|nr:hypothetical protein [Niveibacterium sp. 24ML]MCX9154840.1 hypothetical protein [Niveibacterium sp. 24ML]